jgi:hypothetical protein
MTEELKYALDRLQEYARDANPDEVNDLLPVDDTLELTESSGDIGYNFGCAGFFKRRSDNALVRFELDENYWPGNYFEPPDYELDVEIVLLTLVHSIVKVVDDGDHLKIVLDDDTYLSMFKHGEDVENIIELAAGGMYVSKALTEAGVPETQNSEKYNFIGRVCWLTGAFQALKGLAK